MENTCNYSDEWQPYIGDYDKYEYDIRLKNGTIVENCYPNAGNFHSISDEHKDMEFPEADIVEIRFSEKPRYGINGDVSDRPQYEWLDRETERQAENKLKFVAYNMFALSTVCQWPSSDPYHNYYLPSFKAQRGKVVPARDSKVDPKIGRNEPCPCGSGLKYKKCCQLKSNHHGSK
jgi:hypothetical protein